MGCTYRAYTVLGYKLEADEGDPFIFKRDSHIVKAFKHDYEYDPNFQFCPQTGKKLWEKKETWSEVAGYDEMRETYCGYKIYEDYDRDTYYIGLVAESPSDEGITRTSLQDVLDFDIAKFKAHMSPLLRANGLAWDDDDFALWTIQYAGC